MSASLDLRSSTLSTTGFEDGLGRRSIRFDREVGGMLEGLHVRPGLALFETLLRDTAAAVAALDDERFARVHAFERDSQGLVVLSELPAGERLADILDSRGAVAGLDAAIGLLLQTLPALSALHAAGLTHGTVAPGRILLTASSLVVLLDPIYGSALERLRPKRQDLWTTLGVLAPAAAGGVRFTPAMDVAQVSLAALSVAVGRAVQADSSPQLEPLIAEAADIAQIRRGDRFAAAVRRFFELTLPSPTRGTGVSSEAAANEIERIAAQIGHEAALEALGELVRAEPLVTAPPELAVAPVFDAAPAPTIEALPEPAPEPELNTPAEPEPLPKRTPAPAYEPPIEAVAPAAPEPVIEIPPAAAPEPAIEAVAALPPEPAIETVAASAVEPPVETMAAPSVEPPVKTIAASVMAPIPVPEPVTAEPIPVRPSEPVRVQPAAVVQAPAPAPAPMPQQPAIATHAHVPVPVSFPAPVSFQAPVPPPLPVAASSPIPAPAPAVQAAPAAIAVAPPAPAPLRLKAEGPPGYAPVKGPDSSLAATTSTRALPFVNRTQETSSGPRFRWALAAAAVLVIVAGTAAARDYLEGRGAPAPAASAPPVASARPAAAATGSLALQSQPAGARVSLNGDEVGVTPLTIESLKPGRHVVTFTTDSVTIRRTVRIEAGKQLALDVPVYSGWIAVFSPIRVLVSSDGRTLGTSESGRIMLSPGRHSITFSNPEFGYSATETVDIKPGEERAFNLEPTGVVNVNAQPWAELWVDGRRIGETPLANLPVRLGTREFVFRHPQYGERKVTATVTTAPSAISVDFTKPVQQP